MNERIEWLMKLNKMMMMMYINLLVDIKYYKILIYNSRWFENNQLHSRDSWFFWFFEFQLAFNSTDLPSHSFIRQVWIQQTFVRLYVYPKYHYLYTKLHRICSNGFFLFSKYYCNWLDLYSFNVKFINNIMSIFHGFISSDSHSFHRLFVGNEFSNCNFYCYYNDETDWSQLNWWWSKPKWFINS